MNADDVISEACYAKNNMLQIGGAHPITAVLGIAPSILPDFESTLVQSADDDLDETHAANRASVRLREIAIKCMVEATAQSRMSIANKTQTRRAGEKYHYKPSDLVDVYRRPEGSHAKDTPGWRGPCTVTDVNSIQDGQISVRWNGRVMISSIPATRPHVTYTVSVLYGWINESSTIH